MVVAGELLGGVSSVDNAPAWSKLPRSKRVKRACCSLVNVPRSRNNRCHRAYKVFSDFLEGSLFLLGNRPFLLWNNSSASNASSRAGKLGNHQALTAPKVQTTGEANSVGRIDAQHALRSRQPRRKWSPATMANRIVRDPTIRARDHPPHCSDQEASNN